LDARFGSLADVSDLNGGRIQGRTVLHRAQPPQRRPRQPLGRSGFSTFIVQLNAALKSSTNCLVVIGARPTRSSQLGVLDRKGAGRGAPMTRCAAPFHSMSGNLRSALISAGVEFGAAEQRLAGRVILAGLSVTITRRVTINWRTPLHHLSSIAAPLRLPCALTKAT
jgi:hypothetical protein